MKGPYLFGLVALAALALLPKTGWIVRNHLEAFSGGATQNILGFSDGSGAALPKRFFDPDQSTDPAVRALLPKDDYANHIQRLEKGMADPSLRPKIRASALRISFQRSYLPDPQRKRDAEFIRDAERSLAWAKEGASVEPDNGFYPMCAWTICQALGRKAEGDPYLRQASQATRFDNGANQESELVIQGIERQYGYRGQILRIGIEAGILFPEYASWIGAARETTRGLPLNDWRRRALLTVGQRLAQTSDWGIGILVAIRMQWTAIGYQKPDDSAKAKVNKEDSLRAFLKANPDLVESEVRATLKVPSGWPVFENIDLNPKSTPFATVVFASLLAALLMALPVSKRTEESSRFHLSVVGLTVGATLLSRTENAVLAAPCLAAALGIMAWIERRNGKNWPIARGAIVTLIVAVSIILLAGYVHPAGFGLLPIAFAFRARRRPLLNALAIVIASGLLGVAAFQSIHREPNWFWIATGLLALVPSLRQILGVRAQREWAVVPVALIYLFAVGWELQTNAELGRAHILLRQEADRMRKSAGIPPLPDTSAKAEV